MGKVIRLDNIRYCTTLVDDVNKSGGRQLPQDPGIRFPLSVRSDGFRQ